MTILVFIASLAGAMAIGVPIAFSLMFCGVALMLWLGIFDSQIIAQNMIDGSDNFQLLAVPFFLLAGELMNAGGLSRRIISFAVACVGHFRGGLGYVAVIAAVIMAAMSGSAAADTAALAAILVPMMRQAGYNMPRATGLIASGGVIAPVIPPSIGFIVFGVASGVSIPQLMLAGIAPGVLMGLSIALAWAIVSRKETMAVAKRVDFAGRLRAFRDGFFALLMPVIVIGSIRSGIATPTEAAVIAVAYSLVFGLFVYRELKISELFEVCLLASKTSAAVMFLVAASLVSAWLITQASIPSEITELLRPLMDNPTLLLFVMMAIVWVIGTALDFTPTVLILTPILMPIVREAGIHPVYFGVLFIFNNAVGLITPPVGIVLNVVCGVARVPMGQVIKGVMPFVLAQTLLLVLLILFPNIVLQPLHWLRR